MYENSFTEKAAEALKEAVTAAREFGHAYVGTEHILMGLLRVEGGLASEALSEADVTADDVAETIAETVGAGVPSSVTAYDLTPRAKLLLENAASAASESGSDYIGTEHLLAAMLSDRECKGYEILRRMKIDVDALYESLADAMGGAPAESGGKEDGKALEKYGRDLTALAKAGKLDPVIGRDKELERVVQILSRRTKNNPCLIGEPGVGKTA
ncbi:MAG: ATP-dependent Clp protease ATP-binding subunit, partial [Clostridia bacterium]|nr:ATP-dependent Clp protease ATP-binding subunit [Clostridia bacterium]